MESLVRTLPWVSLALLVFLGGLQIIPPLARIYLRRTGAKRLKSVLFGVAFVALYMRVMARLKIRTDDGVVLSGNLRTNTLLKCVYLTGCYEPSFSAYLKRKLNPGDIFLDIGANSGHFSLIAAKLGAEVISIEASPSNCRLFSENVTANAFGSKIRLIEAAAGSHFGSTELREIPFNGMCSTTSRVAFWYLRPISRKITVPLVRVDDILRQDDFKRIRFVKIDVEGAELMVLQGLRTLLSSGRPDLEFCLEFSPSWLTSEQADQIFSTFRSTGYRAFKLVNAEIDFPPYDTKTPEPCTDIPTKQVDLVFSRIDPVPSGDEAPVPARKASQSP